MAIEERPTKSDDSSNIRRDHNRAATQAILRNLSGGFVAIKSTIHLDIIDDVPSMVLLGQEEPAYHQNFILCNLDGTIEGTGKSFTDALEDLSKVKGKKIHEILSLSYSPDCNLADQERSKAIKGKLISNKGISTNSLEGAKEVSFLITQLDNANPSKAGYYLINIYEKNFSSLFEKRNSCKENQTLQFAVQMEIKMETPPPQRRDTTSIKTLNFASIDNLTTKKDDLELQSTDARVVPAEEYSYLYNKEPKLFRKLTSKIDVHHGLNPFSVQDTNSPEKSWIASRGVALNSQELNVETQKNFISINSFAEDELNTSLGRKFSISEALDDDEQLRNKRNNLEFIKNQRASSISSSINGVSKHKRALESIKRKLKNPSVPLEIRSMKLLPIVTSIGLIAYLIADYVDLSRRYLILSELSGLTSFPLILLRSIYSFFQVQEIIIVSLNQLWSFENRYIYLFIVPQVFTVNTYQVFNFEYNEYVLQANPQTYYSDFRYDNYTIDLSLPDTPYLNRPVDFHEALAVLRGYLYKLYEAVMGGSFTHEGAFSFLRKQSLNYDKMLWTLSEDLFNRMNRQFDDLLVSLQLRILVGAAVAFLVGSRVFYTFLRLYRHKDELLSKMLTISGSELTEEINRLEEKVIIMARLENSSHDEKSFKLVAKKALPKDLPKKHSISKKYIPLRKEFFSKLVTLFFVGLYLIPPIIGYYIKADPVSDCLPLLSQYKIIVSNAQNSIGMTCQLLESVASAAAGDANQSAYFLSQTQSFLEEAQNQSAELSNFLNNQEALEENHHTSHNLTKAIASLRSNSYCDLLVTGFDEICRTITKSLSSLGVAPVRTKTIEWALNFRTQLTNSNFDMTAAADLTFDETLADLEKHGQSMSIALGKVAEVYIENFKEIATTANSTLWITLIVSFFYYLLLLAIFLFPFISWVEKQYKELKEIYTLLPAQSLLANPYIKSVLKGKDRWYF